MGSGPWRWGKAHINGNKKAHHRDGGKAKESERSQKWGETCKHQGTHKDKDIDTRGPLRQEQPAHGDKGKAPRNRDSPHRDEGTGVEYGNLP